MIHELWTYNILEFGEFRILGTRYETVNKLSKVSLASDQVSLRNRVVAGNTIKLSFQSTEPVNNVSATIQGEPATIATTDNLNWTATLVIKASTAPGPVKFLLNYQTAGRQAAEPTIFTTDSTTLFIAGQTDYIANLLDITTVTDSSNHNAVDTASLVARLFDNNLSTAPDYRVNGSGNGGWVSFDFRSGGTVKLSHADIIGLQNSNSGRIEGAVVQASNDYTNWTTISTAAANTMDWQLLKINDASPYRYVRIYNPNAWYGNMTELRLYGEAASTQKIVSLSITSPQAMRKRIIMGDTVSLNFKAKEAISNVTATIQGKAATVSTTDNINFTATTTLGQGSNTGTVQFAINYTEQNGQAGNPGTQTTDGSWLILVDESDVIQNIPTIATLIDSTTNRTAADTLKNVNYLFDANLGTGSDFRNGSGGSGSGAWVVFDFKAGNQVTLTGVEAIGRQDQYSTRMSGMVLQGSNDNATWATLTPAAVSTMEWQTLPVTSLVPYRYIRVYNPNAWFGSMNELRLHGRLWGADVSAPVTTANAPTGWAKSDTTVTLTPVDASGVQFTYYKVDGGAQQTGTSATFTTEGTHTLVYWSVDWAGNVEAQKTATVKIDKTAPVSSATVSPAAPANGWYNSDVTVNLSAPADAGSPIWATNYTVDGAAQQTANTVVLSAKGTHTVAYWSVDQAGNAEQPRTLSFNIGPIDVSSSVHLTQQGAGLNRSTGKYVGSVTVTNTSGADLTGPLQLVLSNLTAGLTLDNATGMSGGVPYITLSSPLNAGATISVPLTFTNPNRTAVGYTPVLYQGNL